MAKFMLAYRGGSIPQTDAERSQVMTAWGEWFDRLGSALVDPGNPFGPSQAVTSNGTEAPAPSALTGYSIVTAEDLDAAIEHARGCPVLTSGGMVDVYTTFEIN